MQSKELDEKFSSTEMENLQKKLDKQEQEKMIEVERQKDTEELKKKIEEEVWERLVKTLQEGVDAGRIIVKGN